MWVIIKALFTKPSTWVALGLVALTIFVSSLMISNNNLGHKNDLQKLTIQHQEQVIKIQERSIKILERDIVLLDELNKSKQQVVVKQSNLQKRLDAIPNTSKDRPFSDNNLFTAARELRTYQNDAYPNDSSNNNH